MLTPFSVPYRSFRPGRQEDAHEYAVALLDAIHEACLARLPRPLAPRAPGGLRGPPPPVPPVPAYLAATSLIYRLFAGRLHSAVRCCSCGYVSTTDQPFTDVALDIAGPTLDDALRAFTAGEVLDGDNAYACPAQGGARVRAVKAVSIADPPPVLVFQLKRFEYAAAGRKVSKKVDFEPSFDLAPYTPAGITAAAASAAGGGRGGGNSGGGGAKAAAPPPPLRYSLAAVLVHSGHSVHAGHYTAFARSGDGLWHHFDDASVSQVAERVVLAQRAYMMFYVRDPPPAAAGRGRAREGAGGGAQPAVAAPAATAPPASTKMQRARSPSPPRPPLRPVSPPPPRPRGAGVRYALRER